MQQRSWIAHATSISTGRQSRRTSLGIPLWFWQYVSEQGQNLLPRVTQYYHSLVSLPRRVRRALGKQWATSLTALAFLLAIGGDPAQAATLNVAANETAIAANGQCSLIEAIVNANANAQTHVDCLAGSGADTIVLSAGSIHTLTTVNNTQFGINNGPGPNGLPVISSVITIAGNGSTIERSSAGGTPEFRLMLVSSTGNLTLENLTLRGGKTTGNGISQFGFGAGVYNADGTLALLNTTISGNTAEHSIGGGLINGTYGTVTLTNSAITNNAATGMYGIGGGVVNSGRMTLTHSAISGNTTKGQFAHGGGVHNSAYATLTLMNSTISNNATTSGPGAHGGGVATFSTLTLLNSLISGNVTSSLEGGDSDGGGVWITTGGPFSHAIVTLINSTVSGNTATPHFNNADGGGLAISYDSGSYTTVTLINSTVTGNTAAREGGGVHTNGARVILTRSILSGNRVGSSESNMTLNCTTCPTGSVSTYVSTDDFNVFGLSGGSGLDFSIDTTDADHDGKRDIVPAAGVTLANILGPLADNGGPTLTHALVPGSPAIDTVTNGSCPPPDTDQRGFERPVDGNGVGGAQCDSGAVEFGAAPPLVPLDPFQCYKTKATRGSFCAPDATTNVGGVCETEEQCGGTTDVTALCLPDKFPKDTTVTLTDQFDTDARFDVQKPVSMCNPAGIAGSNPTDPLTHFQGFQIKASRGEEKHLSQPNLTITNEFHPSQGELRVDTLKPDRLLVPSLKDESTPPGDEPSSTVDHFKCYKVKVNKDAPKFPKGIQVTVSDQFDASTLYEVVKPTRLCTPVDKNGEEPGAGAHAEHLMCYQVRPARGEEKHVKKTGVFVNNQLRPDQVDTIKEDELCVPSTKSVP